jgi:hypothetical protein
LGRISPGSGVFAGREADGLPGCSWPLHAAFMSCSRPVQLPFMGSAGRWRLGRQDT